MKLHKLFFTILILFTSFQICFGQEKPQAELIDNSDKVDCCRPVFQYFLSEIINSNADGYIIIFGDKNNKLENYLYEQSIKSWSGLQFKKRKPPPFFRRGGF